MKIKNNKKDRIADQSILDALAEGADIVDKNLNIRFANNLLLKNFGKNIIGKKCYQVYKTDKKQCDNCPLKKGVKSDEKKAIEVSGIAGGKTFSITHSGIRLQDGSLAILELFHDITEEKNLRKQLRYIEEGLKLAQKLSKVGSWDWNIKEGKLVWSDEIYRQYDLRPGEISPSYEKWKKFIHPGDIKRVESSVKLALKKGKPYSINIRMISKKGRQFVIRAQGTVFKDKNGKVFRFIGTQQDITEQALMSKVLHESEDKYRILTETSLDCIKIFNVNGDLLYINKGGLREHGLKSVEEAIKIGWKAVESVVPDDQAKFAKALRNARRGLPSVIEIRHTKKGSTRDYCEETIMPIKDENNKVISIFGVSRDISERKKVEEKLKKANKELEEQREAILNVIDDIRKEKEKAEKYLKMAGNMIVALDKRGIITLINEKGNEVLGYKNGDLVGKNWFDKCLPKENLEEMKRVFAKLMSGANRVMEKYENLVVSRTGEQKVILWHNSLLHDIYGRITGVLSSGEDITELKRIDKAKTEFVSLASHQLRTPLAAVNWYGEMLKNGDVGKLNQEQQKYINNIYDNNRRMSDLVSALLNVSRIELGTFIIDPVKASLKKIVVSVANEMKPEIMKKKINFKINFSARMPKKIMLDEKLTRMIITNILSNAVKYTPPKGKVSLQVAKTKENITVTVKDTGYGIPANQQGMIFTKLFRADNIKKRDTTGTGLGLYLVKSVLDHIGGKIRVESRENKGSTFYVSIPLKGFVKKEGTKYLE